MELARYLRIVGRWWPLVANVFVVAVVATVVLVQQQPAVYESSGTFVVRPRSVDQEDAVRAFDTLIRGVEINATYAAIAKSGMIRDLAQDRLDDAGVDGKASVAAEIVTGTNILELTVQGPDPGHVHALASALADEIVTYIDGLDDAYVLAPLDPPEEPGSPVGPARRLTIVLGVVLGLGLGVGLALVAERLKRGLRSAEDAAGLLPEAPLRDQLVHQVDLTHLTEQRLGVVAVGGASSAPDRRTAVALRDVLRDRVTAGVLADGRAVVLVPGPSVDELRQVVDAHRGADGVAAGPDVQVCVVGRGEYDGDPAAVLLVRRLLTTAPVAGHAAEQTDP